VLFRSLPWVRVAHPEFQNRDGKATTDFHDLWQREGPAAVLASIEKASRIQAPKDAANEDFDHNRCRVDRFLDFEPPEQKYLIPDLIPYPVIGGILGAGGSRKSTLLLELACSVATGFPWAGGMGGLPEPGGVIFVSCEDDDAIVHRRLRATINGMADGIQQSLLRITELLRTNLYVLTRPGKNTLLVEKKSNQAEPTKVVSQIINMALEVENLRLVIIEPISRLFGGNENDAADMSRMIEALESIREATGVTVLVAHHISKAALREEGANQASARGSSALVDGMRWVAQLRTANNKDIQHENHTRWACFDVVKSNYVAIQNGIWLRASNDGYLRRADPNADRSVTISAKIVNQIATDAEAGKFWTKRGFAENYASSDQFSMGRDLLDKEVEACISADRIYRWEVSRAAKVFPDCETGHRKGTEILLPPPPSALLRDKLSVDLRNRYAAAEDAIQKSA
jgi:RecA-family ATPase